MVVIHVTTYTHLKERNAGGTRGGTRAAAVVEAAAAYAAMTVAAGSKTIEAEVSARSGRASRGRNSLEGGGARRAIYQGGRTAA